LGYASRKKEPLAQVPTRNYNWPNQTQTEGFMFGLKGVVSEYSAKEVVLPPDSQKESEQNR
jgi:EF-hand domain-containing family member B